MRQSCSQCGGIILEGSPNAGVDGVVGEQVWCIACAREAQEEWNADMLKQIPFGPWAQGWKGKLARWLLRLKEDADKRIAAQRSS